MGFIVVWNGKSADQIQAGTEDRGSTFKEEKRHLILPWIQSQNVVFKCQKQG